MTDEITLLRRRGLRWHWRLVCWVSGRREVRSGMAWRKQTALAQAALAADAIKSKRATLLWPASAWPGETDILETFTSTPPGSGSGMIHYRPQP